MYRYSSLIQQSHTAITYEELTTFMKYKQLYGIFEQKKTVVWYMTHNTAVTLAIIFIKLNLISVEI